jgi:hypothetical protein
MKQRLLLGLMPAVAGLLLWAGPVQAEAGLQLNPLKYEDVITGNRVKTGFIDVSNPSDTTVVIITDVQGFRQADLDGNLAFFPDEQLKAGIKPGLDRFELGPRESIRVAFNVDPSKLPRGGVYAAVFFRTEPPTPEANVSYIAEAANVGTLLMLRNGEAGEQIGQVSGLRLPFWQFGRGLRGELEYHNTDRDRGGLAVRPALESRVTPWGRVHKLTGPFIMPQASRRFAFVRPGSYFGLLPVSVADGATGHAVTRWVFALTGWYQVLVLLLALAGGVWLALRRRWIKTTWLERMGRRLRRK